jgi:hypothetical protein
MESKMEFTPIRNIANIIPFNLRLRYLFAKVNELEARINAITGAQITTVAVEASQTIIEPKATVETVQTDESTIIEDELRQKAKGLGVTNWHNKKLENIINEIAELEAGD